MHYIDVVLPLPLRPAFTYEVNEEQAAFLQAGMRVVVPFGKSKIYTAITIKLGINKLLHILPSLLSLSWMRLPCSLLGSYSCLLGRVATT